MNKFIKLFCISLLVVGSAARAMEDLGEGLVEAAKNGRTETVELLLSQSADANYVNTLGYTALMWAAHNGHLPVCKSLVESNADVNEGHFPLWFAACKGHAAICKLLLEYGAKIKPRDDFTLSPLGIAARSIPTCKVLVEAMLRQQVPSKIQKNRWYTFLSCLRNNSDDTIRCAYTPCILDIFKEYLHANIPAENKINQKESWAYEEINKIAYEDVKQELLYEFSMQPLFCTIQ